MVINRNNLFALAPIVGMSGTKEKNHGVSHGLSEAGYDIRIKQTIYFKRSLTNSPYVCSKENDGEWGEKHFSRFILASAIEEFDMPPNLVGVVHDKSTWARQGLSVFNTVIEPGWKGFLTLELIYHGEGDLLIPAGSGIAQVIFHSLIEPTSYSGKYQNQEDKPVSARES